MRTQLQRTRVFLMWGALAIVASLSATSFAQPPEGARGNGDRPHERPQNDMAGGGMANAGGQQNQSRPDATMLAQQMLANFDTDTSGTLDASELQQALIGLEAMMMRSQMMNQRQTLGQNTRGNGLQGAAFPNAAFQNAAMSGGMGAVGQSALGLGNGSLQANCERGAGASTRNANFGSGRTGGGMQGAGGMQGRGGAGGGGRASRR